MAKDEDPTKVPILTTILMIVVGTFMGNSYHLIYTRYTGDHGQSAVSAAIPLIMLVLGAWFLWWTIRKPFLTWFPVAIAIFCFGLGGLFL